MEAGCTLSRSGPARLVDCWKCPQCGASFVPESHDEGNPVTTIAKESSALYQARAALEMAAREISQMHRHYLPNCEGGCPALKTIEDCDNAIAALRRL